MSESIDFVIPNFQSTDDLLTELLEDVKQADRLLQRVIKCQKVLIL